MKNTREQQTISVIKFVSKTILKRSSGIMFVPHSQKQCSKLTSHSHHFPVIIIYYYNTKNFHSATLIIFFILFFVYLNAILVNIVIIVIVEFVCNITLKIPILILVKNIGNTTCTETGVHVILSRKNYFMAYPCYQYDSRYLTTTYNSTGMYRPIR